MLRIEDLKVGDELVCIDRDGFNSAHHANKDINNFIISYIRVDKGWARLIDEESLIWKCELKYFKKKEQYTFIQLQNLAHKAVIDGILEYYHVEFYGDISIIKLAFDGEFTHYNSNDAKSGVEFIQSLYKENFVIECEEDIKRIKKGANITLANGNIGTAIVSDKFHACVQFKEELHWGAIGLFLLKGATVEQEK